MKGVLIGTERLFQPFLERIKHRSFPFTTAARTKRKPPAPPMQSSALSLAEPQARSARRELRCAGTIGERRDKIVSCRGSDLNVKVAGRLRRYARRQVSWFRRYADARWVDARTTDAAELARAAEREAP